MGVGESLPRSWPSPPSLFFWIPMPYPCAVVPGIVLAILCASVQPHPVRIIRHNPLSPRCSRCRRQAFMGTGLIVGVTSKEIIGEVTPIYDRPQLEADIPNSTSGVRRLSWEDGDDQDAHHRLVAESYETLPLRRRACKRSLIVVSALSLGDTPDRRMFRRNA